MQPHPRCRLAKTMPAFAQRFFLTFSHPRLAAGTLFRAKWQGIYCAVKVYTGAAPRRDEPGASPMKLRPSSASGSPEQRKGAGSDTIAQDLPDSPPHRVTPPPAPPEEMEMAQQVRPRRLPYPSLQAWASAAPWSPAENRPPLQVTIFRNEVMLLNRLRHENVVTIFGACTRADTPLCIVQELMVGSLSNLLFRANAKGPVPLSEVHRITIALGVAKVTLTPTQRRLIQQ